MRGCQDGTVISTLYTLQQQVRTGPEARILCAVWRSASVSADFSDVGATFVLGCSCFAAAFLRSNSGVCVIAFADIASNKNATSDVRRRVGLRLSTIAKHMVLYDLMSLVAN